MLNFFLNGGIIDALKMLDLEKKSATEIHGLKEMPP
jgi:hypothetical protein